MLSRPAIDFRVDMLVVSMSKNIHSRNRFVAVKDTPNERVVFIQPTLQDENMIYSQPLDLGGYVAIRIPASHFPIRFEVDVGE